MRKITTNTNLKNLWQNNPSWSSPKLVAFIFFRSQVLFLPSLLADESISQPFNPPTIPNSLHLSCLAKTCKNHVIRDPSHIILSDLQAGKPQKRGCFSRWSFSFLPSSAWSPLKFHFSRADFFQFNGLELSQTSGILNSFHETGYVLGISIRNFIHYR